jgi:hypothetical protein
MLKPQTFLAAALIAFTASPAYALYKCKDEKGKTYYTDRPPAACVGKAMEELNKEGTVVRKREAALTPEQQAARDAEEKRKKEEALAAKEEQRMNRALLNTYSSEKDIEDGRQRALKQVEQATTEIKKRIAQANTRAKRLNAEKEFYVKKPMPKKLQDDIKNNETDLKIQQGALEAKQKEINEINAKYDEDKRRYLKLTKGKK